MHIVRMMLLNFTCIVAPAKHCLYRYIYILKQNILSVRSTIDNSLYYSEGTAWRFPEINHLILFIMWWVSQLTYQIDNNINESMEHVCWCNNFSKFNTINMINNLNSWIITKRYVPYNTRLEQLAWRYDSTGYSWYLASCIIIYVPNHDVHVVFKFKYN